MFQCDRNRKIYIDISYMVAFNTHALYMLFLLNLHVCCLCLGRRLNIEYVYLLTLCINYDTYQQKI